VVRSNQSAGGAIASPHFFFLFCCPFPLWDRHTTEVPLLKSLRSSFFFYAELTHALPLLRSGCCALYSALLGRSINIFTTRSLYLWRYMAPSFAAVKGQSAGLSWDRYMPYIIWRKHTQATGLTRACRIVPSRFLFYSAPANLSRCFFSFSRSTAGSLQT
jgi:hypothetical protein